MAQTPMVFDANFTPPWESIWHVTSVLLELVNFPNFMVKKCVMKLRKNKFSIWKNLPWKLTFPLVYDKNFDVKYFSRSRRIKKALYWVFRKPRFSQLFSIFWDANFGNLFSTFSKYLYIWRIFKRLQFLSFALAHSHRLFSTLIIRIAYWLQLCCKNKWGKIN